MILTIIFAIVFAMIAKAIIGGNGFVVGLIFGGLIGRSISKSMKAEEEEKRRRELEETRQAHLREEQENQRRRKQMEEAERREYQQWKDVTLPSVLDSFKNIKISINAEKMNHEEYGGNKPLYDENQLKSCREKLSSLKTKAMTRDSRYVDYQGTFILQFDKFVNEIKLDIDEILKTFNIGKPFDIKPYVLMRKLYLLLFVTGDEMYEPAARAAYQFVVGCVMPFTHVGIDDYGTMTIPIELDEMEKMSNIIPKMEKDIDQKLSLALLATDNDHYDNIAKYLERDIPMDSELAMWFYARKKPFDVAKFETACERYGRFTRYVNTYSYVELIARIFSKKEIGGEVTVTEDKKVILEWVAADKNEQENHGGHYLASALAAMELYGLEYEVLKTLVQQRVQLEPTVQERLKFLSEGGTSSVKVYDVDTSEQLLFDNSSADWDEKNIEICFRNMKMKKIIPHYSLIMSRWKKTIPLVSGQKLSKSLLDKNFHDMVKDFDGEVAYDVVSAKAVDLTNVEYPDAVLFHFHSERNRCVNILFHCEKFGRNLNVTILTLFTPEDNLSYEDMKKYDEEYIKQIKDRKSVV